MQPVMMSAPALSDVFVRQGECFVGGAPHRARTLLGSCVSITLWHPGQRVGAMSHFLLASRPQAGSQALDARYGEEALVLMAEGLRRHGARLAECEAKVFGGASMLLPSADGVGRRNGEAAQHLLGRLGLKVRATHLYGEGHRQILFTLETGDVWVRQVSLRPLGDAPWSFDSRLPHARH